MRGIKRGLLTVCSLIWWLGMAGLLWQTGAKAVAAVKDEGVTFPFSVPGTTLRIEGLALYEGITTVGEQERFAADAMAVVITNLGQQMVQQAQVVLWIADIPYVFNISYLPPTQTVLAVEVSGAAFVAGQVQRCAGSAVCSPTLPLRIEENGEGGICITNTDTNATGRLLLHYKRFDAESGIYIGGETHSLPIGILMPGESVVVQPPDYAPGYSRVVGVTEQ